MKIEINGAKRANIPKPIAVYNIYAFRADTYSSILSNIAFAVAVRSSFSAT